MIIDSFIESRYRKFSAAAGKFAQRNGCNVVNGSLMPHLNEPICDFYIKNDSGTIFDCQLDNKTEECIILKILQ